MGMVTAITLFWSNKPNPAIADSGAHFSVSNTEFEGGCDGRGCGDCIFKAK
jgi:hypothetical protein